MEVINARLAWLIEPQWLHLLYSNYPWLKQTENILKKAKKTAAMCSNTLNLTHHWHLKSLNLTLKLDFCENTREHLCGGVRFNLQPARRLMHTCNSPLTFAVMFTLPCCRLALKLIEVEIKTLDIVSILWCLLPWYSLSCMSAHKQIHMQNTITHTFTHNVNKHFYTQAHTFIYKFISFRNADIME